MEPNWGLALFSLIVGALLGGVVQAVVGRYASFKESQGIAAALSSEMSAIVELIEIREYVSHLTSMSKRLSDRTYKPTHEDIFNVRVTQDYFRVFNELTPKIGLLGEMSGTIVRFYSLCKALLEDVNRLQEILEKATEEYLATIRKDLLDLYQKDLAIFNMIVSEGKRVGEQLKEYGRRWWFSHLFS